LFSKPLGAIAAPAQIANDVSTKYGSDAATAFYIVGDRLFIDVKATLAGG